MLKKFLSSDDASRAGLGNAIGAGDAARDARNWPKAREFYRAALDIDGSLAPIWVQYGHALKEMKQLSEAEAAYRQSLSIDDQTADTFLQLGHLHKIMGRLREAEQDYARALERDPALRDARAELSRLGWSAARLRRLAGDKPSAAIAAADAQRTRIALELSDLVDFLQSARYPTGIQRVQLALAEGFAETFDEDQVEFVYFDHGRYAWVGVERSQFLDIVDLVQNGARSDQQRLAIAERIKSEILVKEDFAFAPGCVLVNPGTSWGYFNQFLAIRNAKRHSSIKYAPLVHDCIPLIYQEFCNPALVHDYINWFSGVLAHADLILTNSENTRADVQRFASDLAVQPKAIAAVQLNGRFGAASGTDADLGRASRDILAEHSLDLEDFVLFVSTIEPRKNHAMALSAWSKMLKSRPDRKVPRLVCVGNSGWMNDDFHQRLARDVVLRARVVVLNNVPENVLTLLYRRCLFTLFPSLYEGWGLPISEAIAHGKAPLVSNIASHPEAGGDLAVYFDVNSEADFLVKLERLIDDPEYRRGLERKIAAAGPLQPWSEISRQIFSIVETLEAPPLEGAPAGTNACNSPPPLACGNYYTFARNGAARLTDILHSADVFRDGMNWHAPEYWGCWIKGRSADLAFSLAGAPGDDFLIYLHWTGSPNIDNEATISLPASVWSTRVDIRSGQDRWDCIPVAFKPESKREMRIKIAAAHLDDFSRVGDGHDRRLSSVGVKGLYVAAASDALQRLALSDAMLRGDVENLARRFPRTAVL